MTAAAKSQEVFRAAQQIFSRQPDWVTFYRELLGPDGIVRRLYPTKSDLAAFEKTDAHGEIQQMLAELRLRPPADANGKRESVRVVTIRLPRALHEALSDEAHCYRTSVNQLCISKLMQIVDDGLVPMDRNKEPEQE